MKKLYQLILIATATLLACCSTTQTGLYVGNFSNTPCLDKTRTAYVTSTKLKLTRSDNNIIGEIQGYRANCMHGRLSMDCQQQGCKISINVRETYDDPNAIAALCLCPINIYFTIYDVEGEHFQLYYENDSLGVVSFKEHSVVQIDTDTHDVAFEEGFEYPLILYHYGCSEEDWLDPVEKENNLVLNLYYSGHLASISGSYNNYFLPCDAKKIEVKMDIDDDGSLIITPLIDGRTTDGKPSGDCIRRAFISFVIINAVNDSYHIKVNPHVVTVTDDDGTEHTETVYDYEGDLKRIGQITVDL